ncbi:MAG: flagellar biosynthesis protein FlhB [Candidatus Riflebacteria bacterium]|nr:flagellar biosynthesis protein FlhB [Candidatus Riflebacteria bacterium]
MSFHFSLLLEQEILSLEDNTLPNKLSFAERPFDLQLFAGDKTEPATEKRRREAREKGNVAKSQDLSSVIILLAGLLFLRNQGATIYGDCASYMQFSFTDLLLKEATYDDILLGMNQFLLLMLKLLFPICTTIFVASALSNLIQVGFLFTLKPLTPDIERFNPVSGIRNIFSWKMAAELVKSFLKVIAIAIIPYNTFKEHFPFFVGILKVSPAQGMTALLDIVFTMGVKILAILLAIALLDWGFQKWRYEENLKMSKQEVKEEFKQQEGDPYVKQKIRDKQRAVSSKRQLEEVPQATVIITNPTHIAVAIKYEFGGETAPTVVALGADHLAEKIREIAKEHNIPILENKPLARQMYKTMEAGDVIPEDLYSAVAAILAQVYYTNKTRE